MVFKQFWVMGFVKIVVGVWLLSNQILACSENYFSCIGESCNAIILMSTVLRLQMNSIQHS